MAKIYLSSTYNDLIIQREAVYHVLQRMRHSVIAMEDYVAADDRPLDACLRDVAACDIYIGIFAWRYGFIPLHGNPDRKSITELEYSKACDLDKPRLIFLLAEDADWSLPKTDTFSGAGEGGARIKALREELELERLISRFHTSEELATLVSAAVTNYEKSQTRDAAHLAFLTRLQYLEAVYEHYKSVKLPIGPADGISLLAIFQHLKLRSNPIVADNLEREKRRKLLGEDLSQEEERFLRTSLTSGTAENAQDALARSPQRRIVVLGGPGTGKSTTLKHLVALAAEAALAAPDDTNLPLPIFISLPDLARVNTGLQGYLPHIVDELKIDSSFANDLWQAINTGRAFICLDSLDEVAPRMRGDIIERINTWTADTHNTWIVGSRFTEYKGGQFRRGQFSEWELQVMDAPMRQNLAQRLLPRLQEHFVTAHSIAATPTTFVELIEKHPQAAAWGQNPLLFSLAAIVFVKTGTLPSSRTALYREIVEAVLRVSERDPAEYELLLRDFSSLALWLHEKKGRTFTRSDLITFLQDVQMIPRGEIASITNRIVASGLMEIVARDTFGFRHQTFQEYLAAVELARRFVSPDARVKKEAWDLAWSKHTYSRWSEILRLLVGVLARQYGSEGERLAQRWLSTLAEQRETPEGDPGDLGFLLALKSLSEVAGQGDTMTAETEKIADRIVLIWVEQILDGARNSRQSYARQARYSGLAYEISRLYESLLNVVLRSLVSALMHNDEGVRAISVQILGEMGGHVPIEDLKRMLKDEDGGVRVAAVQALGKQGERVPIEELKRLLEDKDGGVRQIVVGVLGEQRERAPIEELKKMLEDEYLSVRNTAIEALEKQGDRISIEELERMLENQYADIRIAVTTVLGKRVPIGELKRMLNDESEDVRWAVVQVLGEREGVPIEELKRMLNDESEDVRWAVVQVLGEKRDYMLIEDLKRMLNDKVGSVRAAVINALGKQGERAPLEDIMRMLNDEDEDVRVNVVQLLGEIGNKMTMEYINSLLYNEGWRVRMAIVKVLGDYILLEELKRMLNDEDGSVRATAVQVLGEQGECVSIEDLKRMLKDKDKSVRAAVVQVLGEQSESIKIEEMISMLEDKDESVRLAVIEALGKQEGHVPIEALKRMLEDKSWFVRLAVINVLGKQEERAPIEELKKMLEDENAIVRVAVVQALGERGEHVSIEELKKILEDKDGEVRAAVMKVLGKRISIEELKGMLKDKDGEVRVAAVEILGEQEEGMLIEDLKRMLEDEDVKVRKIVVKVLGKQEKYVLTEELRGMLKSKEGEVREEVVKVLGEHMPIEELTGMLEDRDRSVRAAVVRVLGKQGGHALLEELKKLLEDESWIVRMAVVEVLGEQGDRVPTEVLKRMLKDEDNDVRRTTVEALGKREEPVCEELILAVGDENSDVRRAALRVLKRDSEAFSLVTSEALAILHGEHTTGEILGSIQQYFVISTVSDLAKVFPKLLDMLTPLLDWPYWLVRLRTVQALGRIQRNIPDDAIKRLLEMRLDPDPDMWLIREAADDALAEILSLDGIEDD